MNALRERELREAFERELELERLQHQAATDKLQGVIEGLHKVGAAAITEEACAPDSFVALGQPASPAGPPCR